ncbi:MAG: OFA family MFS transporter [Rhodanobacteraceae bacterium]
MSFLDREHTIAPRGYSRWMVPPAALLVDMSIGEAYAFSVFNLPLTKLVGITESAPGDWRLAQMGWIFSIAMLLLGTASAVGGRWVERNGPRKSMALATIFFSGGFMVSALGVTTHQLWLIYLGYGVIGGCGLGIGYISHVSTLIKWFPDHPGLATGMAICGFGGGAMIGSPLGVGLMHFFQTPTSLGLAQTFVAMGIIYFILMSIGALIVRVPPDGWTPDGFVAPTQAKKLITAANVAVGKAWRTPQFWLVWMIIFVNTTAGIGILGQASAMAQEMMPGKISVVAAAGFVGLLSLFNMGGRFGWATLSDYIGRKNTYYTFFALGSLLYAMVPSLASGGHVILYVLFYCVIISMYGGAFSTLPAYLKDLFGSMHVGAIHGRELTAWSAAGVAGPVLVNYIRQFQIASGVPKSQAYTVTLYIMVGLLAVGFICNLLVSQVDARHHHRDASDGLESVVPEGV